MGASPGHPVLQINLIWTHKESALYRAENPYCPRLDPLSARQMAPAYQATVESAALLHR